MENNSNVDLSTAVSNLWVWYLGCVSLSLYEQPVQQDLEITCHLLLICGGAFAASLVRIIE